MYRLHNTSEHGSGVTNMYSLSNAASRAATPLQMGGSNGDHLVLISSAGNHDHMHHHHHHHHSGWLYSLLDNAPNKVLIIRKEPAVIYYRFINKDMRLTVSLVFDWQYKH